MHALVFLTVLFAPVSALAYFDPGTGSMMIQAVVGAMAAIAIFWGRIRVHIAGVFSGNKNNPSSGDAETGTVSHEHTGTETHDENRS